MDDVLLNKVEVIERCLKRLDEEYVGREEELESNFTRQDAIVLNLQRACEAAIDAAMHVVRIKKLGIPQQSRDAFVMMQNAELLSEELASRMQKMVGFRNVAVHNYRALSLPVLRSVLEYHLGDFAAFARRMVEISREQ